MNKDQFDEIVERRTQKIVDEKIGDTINYLVLLEGMMRHQLSRRIAMETYIQQNMTT